MKKIIQILAILFLISCKHGASKIDIKDVEKHRAYQDSAIAKVKTPTEKLDVTKALISEYRNLDFKEKNSSSNYNYYLGRLYSNIITGVVPFNGFLYDTINKKLNDPIFYSNYIDSAIYFSELALNQNSNNLYAFFNIVLTLNLNQIYFEEKIQEYSAMPNYSIRNNNEYQRNINYVFNNSIRFLNIDTSMDKYKARFSVEFSFLRMSLSLSNKKLEYSNANAMNQVLQIDEYISAIDKFPDLLFWKKEFYEKHKNYWQPIIAQVKQEKKRQEEEALMLKKLANLDLLHRYWYVDAVANVSAQIDLGGWDIYAYTSGDLGGNILMRGHGDWKRPYTNQITITPTSGITLSGNVSVGLNSSDKIILTLPNGVVYIQDDDGYYFKNRISTPK